MIRRRKAAGKTPARKLRILKNLDFLSLTVFRYKDTYFQILGNGRLKRLGNRVEVLPDGRIKVIEKTGVKILKPKKLASAESKRLKLLRQEIEKEKELVMKERAEAKSMISEAWIRKTEAAVKESEVRKYVEEKMKELEEKEKELEEREARLQKKERELLEKMKSGG